MVLWNCPLPFGQCTSIQDVQCPCKVSFRDSFHEVSLKMTSGGNFSKLPFPLWPEYLYTKCEMPPLKDRCRGCSFTKCYPKKWTNILVYKNVKSPMKLVWGMFRLGMCVHTYKYLIWIESNNNEICIPTRKPYRNCCYSEFCIMQKANNAC